MGMNNRLLRPRQSGFNPRSISGLALWLDAADSQTLYTTDAGPVTAVSAPTEISGCVGWYDASDAATLFAADTGSTLATTTVGRWANKGTLGSAGDLLQATSAARPSMTAATQNGKPVLTFDGSNDSLRSASFTLNQPFQYYMVFRFDSAFSSGAPRVIDAGTQPSPGRSGEVYRQDANTLGVFSGGTNTAVVTSANIQSFGLHAFSFDGASSYIRYKAGDIQSTATAGAQNGSRLTVGGDSNATASLFSNVSVAEIIVFNTALSTADRARVEAYLAAKWGISGVHAQATATNDPVGAWLDKSGNARHATQATAGNRPRVQAAGMNGRRSVQFFGGNTELLSLGDLSAVFPAAGEIVVAFEPLSDTSYGLYETRANSSYFRNANGLSYFGALSTGRQAGIAVSMPSTGRHIAALQGVLSGTTQTVLLNGAQVFTGAMVGGYNAGSVHVIGNNNNAAADTGLTGYVSEILAFPRILTSSERRQINAYLASKWGITLAPQVSNADAQDWVNRVYANGGTVSATTASAVNTFCNAIDAAGIRDRFFRVNLFCGDSDASLAAVRTPLFRGQSLFGTQYGNAIDTNVNFVQGDYAETGISGGLMGNGTNKSLQTGIRPDQMPTGFESNVHIAVYRRTTGNGQALLGSYYYNTSTTTDRHNYELALDGGVLGREVGAQVPSGSPHPRFTLATRSSSSSMFTYSNGTAGAENTGVVAGVATGVPFTVFGRNLITGNPPASGTYSATFNTSSILCGYSIGASLTPAQVTAYTAAMQAFQTALSRNV